MSRVKGGPKQIKRRRNILRQVKGYRFGRSKKKRAAREAIVHAGKYAFQHRRDKKSDFRMDWIVRVNAAVRPHGLSYSRFMSALKKKNIAINRKMLSILAAQHPETFERVVAEVK